MNGHVGFNNLFFRGNFCVAPLVTEVTIFSPQKVKIVFSFLFQAEDLGSPMNKDRRIFALRTYLYFIETDIERERKGREGVEKLLDIYQKKPNYGDSETQEDIKMRLTGVSMLCDIVSLS
jgi:hypothetical protein